MTLPCSGTEETRDDQALQEVQHDRLRLKELLTEKQSIESNMSHQGFRDASSRNRLCEEIAALDDTVKREAWKIADGQHR